MLLNLRYLMGFFQHALYYIQKVNCICFIAVKNELHKLKKLYLISFTRTEYRQGKIFIEINPFWLSVTGLFCRGGLRKPKSRTSYGRLQLALITPSDVPNWQLRVRKRERERKRRERVSHLLPFLPPSSHTPFYSICLPFRILFKRYQLFYK